MNLLQMILVAVAINSAVQILSLVAAKTSGRPDLRDRYACYGYAFAVGILVAEVFGR